MPLLLPYLLLVGLFATATAEAPIRRSALGAHCLGRSPHHRFRDDICAAERWRRSPRSPHSSRNGH